MSKLKTQDETEMIANSSTTVPHGYKKTEVGVIPEDWRIEPLGHVVSRLMSGVSVNSVDDDTDNSEPAILKTSSVQSGMFIPQESKKITVKDRKRAKLHPRENTILISRMNTIDLVGECGFVGQDYKNLYIPDRLWMTQFYTGIFVSARWLSYVLSSSKYRTQLRTIATGTSGSMKNIAKSSLLGLPVAFPSSGEQRAIAEVLSDVDGLLGALEKLIAKKRAIKQATMQQLLTGKTRLPGFSGKWETKRLDEIGDISGAGVDKKVRPNEEPIFLVNYMDVYRKSFLYSKDLSHEVSATPDQIRRCAVKKGDIFFTPTSEVRDDIGHSAIAMEDFSFGVYSYHVVRLRLSEDWALRFRAYVFNTKDFFDQASMSCEGSGTRYVITLPRFRSIIVCFPPNISEQAAIAEVLSDMDVEIEALVRRRDKTRAIKQGMMQQLLTGRVRLVKPGGADCAQ